MGEIAFVLEDDMGFSNKSEEGAKYKTEGFGIYLVNSHLLYKVAGSE